MGSQNNLIDSKLLQEEEIKNYLAESFKTEEINPYDDRYEIHQKMEEAPDGINYEQIYEDEIVKDDGPVLDSLNEPYDADDGAIDLEFENEPVILTKKE